jgi:hypothetical protein
MAVDGVIDRERARARFPMGAALAAILVVLSVAGCGSSDSSDSGAEFACSHGRLFASDSVWNACLPEDAPTDPESEELVGALVEEVETEQEAGTGPFIQTDSFSTPLYVVHGDEPVVRVALSGPPAPWREGLQQAFERVPIPREARPAAGSDAHLTVWQPSRDRLWEFWQAREDAGDWKASWGGAIRRVSRSPGYYDERSWPGLSEPHWGASASSLPVVGGTILIRELRAGRIDHALALGLPAPRADWFAWPAQRTDGTGSPSTLPEGAHLRLDPDLDLESLDLPRTTLIMARAAQQHGIIVRDQTGVAIGFYAEDPAPTGDDPYQGPEGFFQGESPTRLLENFPWDRLEVLRMRLCQGSEGCPEG